MTIHGKAAPGVQFLLAVVLLALAACAKSGHRQDAGSGARAEARMLDQIAARLRTSVEGEEIQRDGKPKVMILGVFHFAGSNDLHQSKYQFNVRSPEGQEQLREVLDRLAAFKPTRIGVERNSDQQAGLDKWYEGYKAGNFPDATNEIITIGFALASRLGHQKVYGIDADGYWLPIAPEKPEDYNTLARSLHQEHLIDAAIDQRYMRMYDQMDQERSSMPLRQQLLLYNHPDYVRLGHGNYLVGGFEIGNESNFAGVDGFSSMWQHRNLRIFRNIERLAAAPEDRVLILIGAGHLPLLQFNASCCPTMELVPVQSVLSE